MKLRIIARLCLIGFLFFAGGWMVYGLVAVPKLSFLSFALRYVGAIIAYAEGASLLEMLGVPLLVVYILATVAIITAIVAAIV